MQKDNEDGTKEYAFTPRRWNPADLSPELREMFNICFALGQATTPAEKDEGVELLKAFMKGLAEEKPSED